MDRACLGVPTYLSEYLTYSLFLQHRAMAGWHLLLPTCPPYLKVPEEGKVI